MDAIRAIADAVFYEGYILWPYRRSPLKNQQRFTFGGVYPRGFPDTSALQVQCLLEGTPDPALDVRVRFLHVVRRRPMFGGNAVDELVVGDERHLAWDEAVERELAPGAIDIPAGHEEERLADDAALVRSWEALQGVLAVSTEPSGEALHRITARVENETPWDGGDRDTALQRTFCSTHLVLHANEGAFVSLTDPPRRYREAATGCRNAGLWPVLVGEEGARDTVLAAPIIFPDYPQITPESLGEDFDATEIDELLALDILALTEEEKAEIRRTAAAR